MAKHKFPRISNEDRTKLLEYVEGRLRGLHDVEHCYEPQLRRPSDYIAEMKIANQELYPEDGKKYIPRKLNPALWWAYRAGYLSAWEEAKGIKNGK